MRVAVMIDFQEAAAFHLDLPPGDLKLLSFQYEREAGLVVILGKPAAKEAEPEVTGFAPVTPPDELPQHAKDAVKYTINPDLDPIEEAI